MNKNLKTAAVATMIIVGTLLAYRVLFIRTVNYNIAGIDIPAKYNVLTGKAVPITDYKGKTPRKTITDQKNDKIGMSRSDVLAAQIRWALFAEWAKSKREYKGWESDPEIFRKANDKFKATVPSSVTVVQ